jgi:toxin secretion/phage lysis holin
MILEHSSYIGTLFAKLFQNFWAKIVTSGVLSALFFSEGSIQPLTALVFLVILDFLMGIIAAKKCGEEIKSRKAFRTALKLFIYIIMAWAAHLTTLAGLDWAHLDLIVVAFLAVTEFISLIENAGRMGYAVPNKLLNQLRHYRDNK